MKLCGFYPIFFKDYGIAHACYNLIRCMQNEQLSVQIYGLASDGTFSDSVYNDLIPGWLKSVAYKFFTYEQLHRFAERIYVWKVGNNNQKLIYLWPSVSLEVYQAFKNKGFTIIYEGVNTHEANIKKILDKEYLAIGLPLVHGITDESIRLESAKLALSDYIFSCSEIMTSVYLEHGVPHSKILQTSYGLPKSKIKSRREESQSLKVFTFIGSINPRKGVHLLLDYWVKAGVNAKLRLVGQIDDVFKPLISSYVNKFNIEHLPFTNDLASIYESTDVFVLPSLEEGSPLVTYLALGAGLPVIVTPMSAGGVVKNDLQGIVLDPHDEDGWIRSIKTMCEDSGLRNRYSKASLATAPNYTWENVAKKRRELLLEAIIRDRK